MKKILFVICLVISFIFTSCEGMNIAEGDYMIVREIMYPQKDNTVRYTISKHGEAGEYFGKIVFRDEIYKYQINDTLILVKKCAYSH